ncbi:OadG family protein [Bacteroides reticulotermitis]|uniref:OadG family protein n=1 Tax=Bacteroides reticulotermitis TaxID=1133319 RepID=UPI003A866BE3
MNKTKIGIFFSLLLMLGLSFFQEGNSSNKLALNEVQMDTKSNLQDDGLHSTWIETFNNSSYSSSESAVTPSTNDETAGRCLKVENYGQYTEAGIEMSASTIAIVFVGLILLFIVFKIIGKPANRTSNPNASKAVDTDKQHEAVQQPSEEAQGEVYAAIAMALHEMQEEEVHDVEETVLTITRVKRSYSPWSSKIYTLRETPHRK